MSLGAARVSIIVVVTTLAVLAIAEPQQAVRLTVCVQGGADYLIVHSEGYTVVARLQKECYTVYVPPGVYRVLALTVRGGELLVSGTRVSLSHDAKITLTLGRPGTCESLRPVDAVFIGGSPYVIADCDGTPTLVSLSQVREYGGAVLMGGEKRAGPLTLAEAGLRVRKRVTPVYIPVLIAILTSIAVYVVVKRAVGG